MGNPANSNDDDDDDDDDDGDDDDDDRNTNKNNKHNKVIHWCVNMSPPSGALFNCKVVGQPQFIAGNRGFRPCCFSSPTPNIRYSQSRQVMVPNPNNREALEITWRIQLTLAINIHKQWIRVGKQI
ncbi:hypothetical protein PoB_001422200 [Plakobranchus ocellatus]|uniref:Uncharacterized protein n=1 Tax=Plakobranchus ocellatus TaxID=259542 RepID=A0AAV3YZI1_9GAST|nr:hypothetical protein PoB_001422200 [Plakobranchus ocellatus]